jgi:hypothetical protein|tara:strand:- start:46 stop:762 length:717 start_codon:yes stop_codon:yes gene_type:complete
MFNEQYRKEGPLLGMLGLGGGIARARGAGLTPGGFPGNALYAFSGNNTTTDATGNGVSIVHSPGFSTTEKKWASYTHSFRVDGSGYSRVETPTYDPTGEWSIEFWNYSTAWAGKYLFTAGPDNDQPNGPAINVQSGEFRTYGGFYSSAQVNYNVTTSNWLNQWNFWQIYRNGSTTRYVLNGTQITNCSANATKIVHMVFGNKQSSDTFPITGYFNDIVVYEGGSSRGQQSVPTTPFGL